jgi:hypothetical protein
MRGECHGTNTLEQADRVAGYLKRASAEHGSIQLLDFNEFVCPRGECSAITTGGVVVFRDSQHLTDTFAVGLLGQVLQRYPGLKADG